MYGSVREYKVKGSDLTSILPEYNSKGNKGRFDNQNFLFRLRIDYPMVDVMNNVSYQQFNYAGFSSSLSVKDKDRWEELARPKF